MPRHDLWSNCCEYLEKEGWGDVGLLKIEKPEEYESILKYFNQIRKKFKSSPDDFRGAGVIMGIGSVPPYVGSFLVGYKLAQSYEVGDVFRRYILHKAIADLKTDIQAGKGRAWGETDSLAYERAILPRSEQLRQEVALRPDGDGPAVSRAGRKFHNQVLKEMRQITDTSPWLIGIYQFFIWKQGFKANDESKLAADVEKGLVNSFYDALKTVVEELNQYGLPSQKEMIAWYLSWQKELHAKVDQDPELKRLILPFIFGYADRPGIPVKKARAK